MIPRTESELHAVYPDLLGEQDAATVRIARLLDAGYNLHRAPVAIRSLPAGTAARRVWSKLDRLGASEEADSVRRTRWRPQRKLSAALAVVTLGAIVLATSVTNAGPSQSSIGDLGAPVSIQSTNSYFPLSGFHRISTFPRAGGKPELLFLGAQTPASRVLVERWAVVKALSQFGKLTGLKPLQDCHIARVGPMSGQQDCAVATYDFSHARYSSAYLSFVSKDLVRTINFKDYPFQTLSPVEKQFYDKYVRAHQKPSCLTTTPSGAPVRDAHGQFTYHTCTSYADYVDEALSNTTDTRTFPLVTVGGYLQTVSQILTEGDFGESIPTTPPPGQIASFGYVRMFSFDTVHTALVTAKNPVPSSHLVENVNAEANIMTALICHATRSRPGSVCNRSVIRLIGKHIK